LKEKEPSSGETGLDSGAHGKGEERSAKTKKRKRKKKTPLPSANSVCREKKK